MIIAQQSAKPLAAGDLAVAPSDFLAGLDQPVVQALMVSLAVVTCEILGDCLSKRILTEEDHPVEGFDFYGFVKPLQMGIQIWTPRRQEDWLYT